MQLQLSFGTLACHVGLEAEGRCPAKALFLGQSVKGLVAPQRSATAEVTP
jgi:hypothetical protein